MPALSFPLSGPQLPDAPRGLRPQSGSRGYAPPLFCRLRRQTPSSGCSRWRARAVCLRVGRDARALTCWRVGRARLDGAIVSACLVHRGASGVRVWAAKSRGTAIIALGCLACAHCRRGACGRAPCASLVVPPAACAFSVAIAATRAPPLVRFLHARHPGAWPSEALLCSPHAFLHARHANGGQAKPRTRRPDAFCTPDTSARARPFHGHTRRQPAASATPPRPLFGFVGSASPSGGSRRRLSN